MSIAEPLSQPVAQPSPALYKIVVWKGNTIYEFKDRANRLNPYRELHAGDLVLVGVHPDNDMRLENDERWDGGRVLEDVKIAEHHAHIVCRAGGVIVRRIAARKDVLLGSSRLTPWHEEAWQPSDDLLIGQYRLTLIALTSQSIAAGLAEPEPDDAQQKSRRPLPPPGVTLARNKLEIVLGRIDWPLRITPGQPEHWQLVIYNGYGEPHMLDWTVSTSPALAADFTAHRSEADVPVPPGGWRSIDLDGYVQRVPRNQAGRYTLTIGLQARDDHTIAETIERELIVGAFTQPPQIEIRPIAGYFSSARYAVRVANPTNTITAYRLAAAEKRPDHDSVSDTSNLACTFHPSDASRTAFRDGDLLVVPPGAAESVHLLVKLKPGHTMLPQGYVVWVEARPPGQSAVGARAFFEPRWWSGWQIDRRIAARVLLWAGLVLVLLGLIAGVYQVLQGAIRQADTRETARFNAIATAYLAKQIALVQTSVYSTSTTMAQTAGPMQTSTAGLAETSRAVGLSITAAAATVNAVAGTATAGAQALPGQLTAAAQAAQSMAQQVGTVAAATAQGEHDQQTAQAAPVQTIMAAETAKSVAEQNATSVNAAAAQGAAAQAAQTAAAAATLIALDTKPVKVGFSQKPPASIAGGTSPAALGPIVGVLLDKSGNPSTRDGYIIEVQLTSCGTNRLIGISVHSSEKGLITFGDLKIANASGNGAPVSGSCSLRIKELNDHLSASTFKLTITP